MDLIEIKGKINTAICYARVVEDEAIEQIRRMCDYPMTEGSRIRIMPDVHSGKGCTIGTTMTITDKAVPNVVGVDIGCGMYAYHRYGSYRKEYHETERGNRSDCKRPAGYLWICDSSGYLQVAARNCHAYNR